MLFDIRNGVYQLLVACNSRRQPTLGWKGSNRLFPFSARLDTTSSNILISYEMIWYLTTFPFSLGGLFTVGYASDAEFKLKICCVLTRFLFQVTFFRLHSFSLIPDYLTMIDYVI
jgi:hypothetical protein